MCDASSRAFVRFSKLIRLKRPTQENIRTELWLRVYAHLYVCGTYSFTVMAAIFVIVFNSVTSPDRLFLTFCYSDVVFGLLPFASPALMSSSSLFLWSSFLPFLFIYLYCHYVSFHFIVFLPLFCSSTYWTLMVASVFPFFFRTIMQIGSQTVRVIAFEVWMTCVKMKVVFLISVSLRSLSMSEKGNLYRLNLSLKELFLYWPSSIFYYLAKVCCI